MSQYINGEYLLKNPDWHICDAEWKAKEVCKIISRNDIKPKNVYDIGCGVGKVGYFIEKYLKCKVIGYDISPQAVKIAQKVSSIECICADFTKTETKKSDLILCLDVVEHIQNYQTFLKQIKNRSKYVVFHIPLDEVILEAEYKIHMREKYGHLVHFTKETALNLLSENYRVIDWFYTDDYEIGGFKEYKERAETYERNQELAARLFSHFNVMVLAQGE